MIKFGISAPGKVILFGEHAVVYGKTAVAVSLDRRTSLDFAESDDPESDLVTVDLPKLGLHLRLSLDSLRGRLSGQELPASHEELLELVADALKSENLADPRQRQSSECFLYALFQVARAEGIQLKAFGVKVDGELSIGAGTGSSASFSVCLNAAFLRWSQLQRNPRTPEKFDALDLEKISSYAYNCERILHGTPSGIDNSICTFGSVIEFRKGQPLRFVSLGSRSLRILLVDTRVGRNTKLLVGKVAELLKKFPGVFERVLECVDEVSVKSIEVLKKLQALQECEKDQMQGLFDELAILIDINQGLLVTCQVSHPSLDLICTTAKKYSFSAKLTGAGGGGYAYVLIPPGASNNAVESLSSDLTENGFTVTETNLGGAGVTIRSK